MSGGGALAITMFHSRGAIVMVASVISLSRFLCGLVPYPLVVVFVVLNFAGIGTSFVLPSGMNMYGRLEFANPKGKNLRTSGSKRTFHEPTYGFAGTLRSSESASAQTFEELWSADADRYFWTIFLLTAILRENPSLDPTEVLQWADVWYLACRETGEDILLTLAIAYIESATWVTVDDRDSFVRFHARAISPKGALGLFQLMSPTACEVADSLGIYYDKSVQSPSDAIISVSIDTSASVNHKRNLVREIILKHIQKHPGSIEAVALNPINNIKMGIYYFAYLKRWDLALEARIESYNAGFEGYVRGWGRQETVPYRKKVLSRYRVYKNEADSARFDLWTERSTRQQVVYDSDGSKTRRELSTELGTTLTIARGAARIEEAR